MSDKIEDGGPAFPWREEDGAGGYYQHVGMSLRDWFAGQALLWCLSEFGGNAEDMMDVGEAAYQVADSMLAARKAGAR